MCVWNCCLEFAIGLYNCNIMHETLTNVKVNFITCLRYTHCFDILLLFCCCFLVILLLLLFSTEHITSSPSMQFVFWHVDQKKNSFTGFMILDTTLNTVDLSNEKNNTNILFMKIYWHAEELLLKCSHHILHKTALMMYIVQTFRE